MYQYGSEAEAYYQAIPKPNIEPNHRPAVEPRKKPDVVFGFQLSLCGMMAFICAFVYIYMYSSLVTKQDELQTLKGEIRELKSAMSFTESKISENLNLDYIRNRASRELGMREPLPHQIVYIELPKQSYTVYDK
jgi:cell division protein FtsB